VKDSQHKMWQRQVLLYHWKQQQQL